MSVFRCLRSATRLTRHAAHSDGTAVGWRLGWLVYWRIQMARHSGRSNGQSIRQPPCWLRPSGQPTGSSHSSAPSAAPSEDAKLVAIDESTLHVAVTVSVETLDDCPLPWGHLLAFDLSESTPQQICGQDSDELSQVHNMHVY